MVAEFSVIKGQDNTVLTSVASEARLHHRRDHCTFLPQTKIQTKLGDSQTRWLVNC